MVVNSVHHSVLKGNGFEERDLRSYFSVKRAEVDMTEGELKKQAARWNNYQNIPEKVWKEVGRYALVNGTKTVIDMYCKIYPKCELKRISVNTWKSKYI